MATCPISKDRIDERVPRINGFISFAIMVSGSFFPILWVMITIDFFLRGFTIKFSPVANLSRLILNKLNLKPKPIDPAPKKFAVRLGFFLTLLMNIAFYSNFIIVSTTIFYMTLIAIGMEAFLGFCIGCHIYSFLIKFNIIKPKLNNIDISTFNKIQEEK